MSWTAAGGTWFGPRRLATRRESRGTARQWDKESGTSADSDWLGSAPGIGAGRTGTCRRATANERMGQHCCAWLHASPTTWIQLLVGPPLPSLWKAAVGVGQRQRHTLMRATLGQDALPVHWSTPTDHSNSQPITSNTTRHRTRNTAHSKSFLFFSFFSSEGASPKRWKWVRMFGGCRKQKGDGRTVSNKPERY
jgi:hypothetical protein